MTKAETKGDAELMLQALLDPGAAVDVVLKGFPGWLRLPDDWDTSSAAQDEHLFYFVAAGEFAAQVGSEECSGMVGKACGPVLRLDTGDLLWVPAGTPFHFWIPAGKLLQAYRFRLKVGKGDAVEWTGNRGRALHFASAWPVQSWARQIAEEAGHRDAWRAERLRGLLLCFFTELARLSPGRHRSVGGLTRAQQESLVQYFAARARSRPTPADMAGHLRLSLDYFTRVFRRTFGQAPRHWLVEQRIQQAAL
ncbi:MAG TPA: hypothetical protein VK970_18050, partial [Candidatus Methylacidiphilales bacterium]|nr:hypothetical protein [Candidatus Methylacidiphilales bacterium]